jgi:hypothetical protein
MRGQTFLVKAYNLLTEGIILRSCPQKKLPEVWSVYMVRHVSIYANKLELRNMK